MPLSSSAEPAKKTGRKPNKKETGRALDNDEAIVIRGARTHNLKNVNITIPRDVLTVITGPSGSGKSSLAFDTIYAEGQRRYVESLSVYARQFLEQVAKPEVESVAGLSPTIAIVQKTVSTNPRSTVGTVTEVYDYLRLLYARIGKPFCWKCGKPIQSQTPQQMTDTILTLPEDSKLAILAPVVRGRKGEYQKELAQLRTRGFVRVRIDGEVHDLSEEISIDRNKKHDIDVYVDRLILKGDRLTLATRVSESVELALKLGGGLLVLQNVAQKTESLWSEKFACTDCHVSYPEPEPRTFSFNSPLGACPDCDGLGVKPAQGTEAGERGDDDPEQDLPELEVLCVTCHGTRLKKESLHFRITGQSIAQVGDLSILEAARFFETLELSARERLIADRILREIRDRLEFLNQVGVGYLSLGRSARSLSGGEAQRIRLATQIGSSLVGVIYVLDEPSIGLHPRDTDRLVGTLTRLRDLGNTVLVVEHDRETMERADWIVDMGPGAGAHGGTIVAEGPLADICKNPKSVTGRYLTGEATIPLPVRRREINPGRVLRIEGAHHHNLKNITVDFPLGQFICITGVSGSGKSTLIIDTLYRLLLQKLYKTDVGPVAVRACHGLEHIDKVVHITQKPIGRTPRSNPSTYTGLFSMIRDLFASLPDAQIRGYSPGRFSFNVKGGRCEVCEGDGVKRVEMHFLPDVYVECEVCRGKRYNRETLEVRYKGKNIAEVLDLTAEEALAFFDAVPMLKNKLKVLNEVGMGYIHLGQAATTLSGGEAQRVKLAKELARRGTGKTVYILDEPTTGLHFEDIRKLIAILQTLVDQGNTVIVIEHNLDLIKVADHIIDLGPEGGSAGGEILFAGTPEALVRLKQNDTAKYLKPYLK